MVRNVFATIALVVVLTPGAQAAQSENTLPCHNGYESLRQGAYEDSLSAFGRCLEDEQLSVSNRAIAHTNRGVAYAATGRFSEAIIEYSQAIEAHPDFVDAFMNRGIAHSELGNFDKALEDLQLARQLDPYNPKVLNALCWSHSLLGQPRKSLSYCDFSWARAPRVANTLDTRAFAYWQLGLDGRAQKDLDKAHRLDPSGGFAPSQRLPQFPVVLAQGLLTALGYNPGAATGEFHPETRAAIEEFQRDRALPINGVVNDTLLASLKEALNGAS